MKYVFLILFLFTLNSKADGPADNDPTKVRQIPKEGVTLTNDQKSHITKRLSELKNKISEIYKKNDPRLNELLPDVEVFAKAVHYCLNHDEFLSEKEIPWADQILNEGIKRADELLRNSASWISKKGYVVRGFRSKIDKSVQPYGLVIPDSYNTNGSRKHRLDIWLHGRGEKQLELGFIRARMGKAKDKFQSADTIMLHPYGRYSNAFKFAGEVDVFEALEHVKKWYRIDQNLIANRGFSMGGAGCWQLAVHYSDKWFASNPGAGFSETPDFLKNFQNQTLKPNWWEKKLWNLYDCPEKSVNLKQCPTIAYSGEEDRQIQAARMMEAGHAKEGMKLNHVIGPKTKHTYHPESAKKVEKWLIEQAAKGKNNVPEEIDFVTYTLKYNRMNWIRVDRLKEHFEKSRIKAKINNQEIAISTTNIDAFHVNFKNNQAPLNTGKTVTFSINQQTLTDSIGPTSKKSYKVHFVRKNEKWQFGQNTPQITKKHNLQGPIDDAFMSKFIFVTPSKKSMNIKFNEWVNAEMARAIKHWRQHFRGDAIVKRDTDLTQKDIASSNLILWGDYSSNLIINRIKDHLPIKWGTDQIAFKNKTYNSTNHALILIYPNPLNPEKYVVLNSSFTFREFAYLNNARQVPMLPDWAIINLDEKPGTVWPGKVVDANFFDEDWLLK